MTTVNRYRAVVDRGLAPEPFVRAALGALEAGFREFALLALDDWARLDIVSAELFAAVASLQRPSWGMWNGLLSALRNARKATLRTADAAGGSGWSPPGCSTGRSPCWTARPTRTSPQPCGRSRT
jgi:hypothetical protein